MTMMQRVTVVAAVLLLAISAVTFAKSTKSTGEAWMGVYTQAVDRELAEAFDLESDEGVVVSDVIEDSPADEAGLREDDIILNANGTKLESSDDLSDIVERAKPGDKVRLEIMRNGKPRLITVTLGEREEHDSSFRARAPRAPQAPSAPRVCAFRTSGERGYIGVSLIDLNEQLGEYFGVKDGNGVLISEVERDSPAQKAGLKAGDIVVAVDGEEVSDAGDLRDLITAKKEGTSASLEIIRDRRVMRMPVEVEEREGLGRSFGTNNFFTIPSIPRIEADEWSGFNSREFKLQMDALRKQMDELRRQMQDSDSWRKDLDKMREELKELREQSR